MAAARRIEDAEPIDPIELLRKEGMIKASDIARALSMELREVNAMMRAGLGFQLVEGKVGPNGKRTRGGPWYTTRSKLREAKPWVLELYLQHHLDVGGNNNDEQ